VVTGPSLVDSHGNRPSRALMDQCLGPGPHVAGGPQRVPIECLTKLGLVTRVEYHPASRFWTFQWIETALFVGVSAALVAFAAWWILKRVS
jgi:hypothetical protein